MPTMMKGLDKAQGVIVSGDLTRTVDLVGDSLTHLLTAAFPRSPSTVYPLAVSIASGASKYQEFVVGKKTLHLAAFENTPKGAARATAMLRYIHDWKGVQVYARGRMVKHPIAAAMMLDCYLEALQCKDWRAHCFAMVENPFERPAIAPAPGDATQQLGARYVFPCAYLKPYFYFERGHPSSLLNLIEAAAIDHGCDWCPLFDSNNFQPEGPSGLPQVV